MRRQRTRKYYLYLKDNHLLGVEWQAGRVRKVIDMALEDPVPTIQGGGEAILLLNREELEHHIVSLPSHGKFSIHNVMAHEAASLMDAQATDLTYDWRSIGSADKEEIPHTLYLLAAHPQDELLSLLGKLKHKGITVRHVVSYLDLFIEKGRTLKIGGGSGLMVLEAPNVHLLFFRDGSYGFERTFELREKGFENDFLLEIRRSFFYAKQKFKIPVERVAILMPPEWLNEELARELNETLEVPVDLINSPGGQALFSEDTALTVLINEASLVPSVLNLLPPSLARERETKRFSYAVSFTEAVLLGIILISTWTTYAAYQYDRVALCNREQQLKAVEARLDSEREKIDRFKTIKQETAVVKNFLNHKKNVHLYLECLPYLVPEQVHLESLFWGAGTRQKPLKTANNSATTIGKPLKGNVFVLEGVIDVPSPELRFSLFFKVLDTLQKAPFVQGVTYYSDDLLTSGKFQLYVHLKEIGLDHGTY